MRTFSVTALLLALVGCAKAPSTSEAPTAEAPAESAGEESAAGGAGGRRMFIECAAEARSAELCTTDYTPVCGQHEDGKEPQTYGNVCGACKDPNVSGYFTGECEGGENL